MSNGIVKPFLHKQLSSTVSSLSPVLVPPPMWSTARSDFQLREADSQPTNYKCGILPGRTDPFPSCCPLTGTTFPPPSMLLTKLLLFMIIISPNELFGDIVSAAASTRTLSDVNKPTRIISTRIISARILSKSKPGLFQDLYLYNTHTSPLKYVDIKIRLRTRLSAFVAERQYSILYPPWVSWATQI